MKPLKIKDKIFGEGIPKICIPLTGKTEAEILEAARRIFGLRCDVVEWRADFFEDVTSPEKVCAVLAALKKLLPSPLLLFTFRTEKEGGNRPFSDREYLALNRRVLESGLADLLDLEFFTGEAFLAPLISLAHEKDVKVILSNHDFEKTPEADDLFQRLSAMEALGGDIAKIAVMPGEEKDVLILLEATLLASKALNCPVITMSMGSLGAISRISGELFGSCLTFGTAGQASAPGQLDAEKLGEILTLLHGNF